MCWSCNHGVGIKALKLVAEYFERALEFERLAAGETNPALKSNLEKQAAAYQKLATMRAIEKVLEPPEK